MVMKRVLLIILQTLLTGSPLVSQHENGIREGMHAPLFSLPYATKDSVARNPLSMSEIIGTRNIVLAFYPAAWSPGCTKEVCSFRDNFSELQSLDAEILAISGDYTWSLHSWAQHHDLPFKLLSDHDHKVARMYESYNETTMYNKRTIYLVDKNGIVRYLNLRYSVSDAKDFELLKEALRKLE